MTGDASRTGWPKLDLHPAITDQTTPLLDLARATEERGLDGFFLPEHTHIPVAFDRSAYPEDAEMPERYKRLYDPYVALSFVAAHTRLDIGTAVSLPGQHDPIALAKTIATLDVLSEGRLTLGFGFGWNLDEFEDHAGVPAAQRPEVVRDHVGLMRALWQQEEAAYESEHARLPPSWSWPKPVQRPHPTVLLGARPTVRNFRRIADWTDGWLAMRGHLLVDDFASHVAELRKQWEIAGRDPSLLRISVLQDPVPPATLRKAMDKAARLGLERVLLHVEDRERAEMLSILDEAAQVLAEA
jgi:probable F420-dependent oxidoreductase